MSDPVAVRGIYGVMSIGGVAMAALAAMNLTEMGLTVAALYFVLIVGILTGVIVVCGLSLIRTIDASLESTRARTEYFKPTEEGLAGGLDSNSRTGQHSPLAVARRKIRLAVTTCAALASTAAATLLFAVASPYGRAAPIFLFVIPLNLLPTIWFEINLLLHSRRSQRMDILHFEILGTLGNLVYLSQNPRRSSSTRTTISGARGSAASSRRVIAWGNTYGARAVIAPTEGEELTGVRTVAFADLGHP